MDHMLEIDSGMIGLYCSLIICDRLYVELITKNRSAVLDEMLSKEQKRFMKQMKNFSSVLRTGYACALLYEKNMSKAEKIKVKFEKSAKNYSYQNDVLLERKLIEIAASKAIK